MAQSYDVPRKTELAERIIVAFEDHFGVAELDDDQFSLAMLATDEAWHYYTEEGIEGDDSEPEVDD